MPEFLGAITRRNPTSTFEFELEAGVQYIIDVVGTPSASGRLKSAYFDLFAGLDFIERAYDSGEYYYPQLVVTPIVSETYAVDVSGYSTGSFALRVFEDDFRYHPIGVAPAGAPTSGGASRGRINYAGDTDIHEVELIGGLRYVIEALGADSGSGSLADPEVRIRDFSGETIAADTSDAGSGAEDRLLYMPDDTGVHFIDVRGADTETGSYRVAVSEGLGTRSADQIAGTAAADVVNARGGADSVRGRFGADVLSGARGADELNGGHGADGLYGGPGRDSLVGELGGDLLVGGGKADALTGGSGADVFAFEHARDSTARHRDVILAVERGTAFGKPGGKPGDIMDLSGIDANVDRGGDQAFRFGSAESIGRVWLEEEDGMTIVRANVDDDARAEFELAISDRSVSATDYVATDFAL